MKWNYSSREKEAKFVPSLRHIGSYWQVHPSINGKDKMHTCVVRVSTEWGMLFLAYLFPSPFRVQQPIGTAPNCDRKQDYPSTRKLVVGKSLQWYSIPMDSNVFLGCRQTDRKQIRQLLGLHQWKTFSALTSEAVPHPFTCGQIQDRMCLLCTWK